jgi:thiamine-phosphate pyrophosphorylase
MKKTSKIKPFLYPILDMEYIEKNSIDPYTLIDLWIDRPTIPFIQLRAKKYSLSTYAKLYKEIIKYKPNIKIIVNDFWMFAIEKNAFGLHIGKEDFSALSQDDGVRLKTYSGIKGTSCHSIRDLLSLDPNIWDYTGLGPIFQTHSKNSIHPTLGVDFLKHLPELGNIHIVLIGGINVQNLKEIFSVGQFSIASISALSDKLSLTRMESIFIESDLVT